MPVSGERSSLPTPDDVPLRLVPMDSSVDPLPRPLTSFVGRERELGIVLGLIGAPNVRLLTLVGPGGVGKTRLALTAARRLESLFPDGVVFVAFDTTTDSTQAPVLIAQAAGVPDAPGQTLVQRMRHFFRQREMVLVLDNLEHLPGIETHIAELLAASQNLKVLCTSRTTLDITGEQVYPVPPLDPAEAGRLFEERARAVEPDFHGDDGEAGTVGQICERLEYLPLAIELAAARIGVLSLPALLTRLDHQLSVLAGGPRDAPARHRAMRDTIGWSHDLLDPADQHLLRRLAVCSGGFSLDAAREIANGSVDALEGVSRLVHAGLARRIPGPAGDARFRLPVPIREFAHEQLDANGESEAVRTRHSRYYRDLAEEAIPHYDGPDQLSWRDRIVSEFDNCRAAMSWSMASGDWETAIRLAGALWRTWWLTHAIGGKAWTERVEEGLSWIDRTLPHRGDLPVQVIAEALIGGGALNVMRGRYPEARAHAGELLRLSEEQHYPYGEHWACFQLGRVAQETGDLDLARTWLERALDLTPRIRDSDNMAAQTLGCLANVAKAGGDDPAALQLAEEGLRRARLCGNPHNISWLGLVAGRLRHKLGDQGQAARILIESTEAYAMDQDPAGERTSLTELGRVALSLDQLEIATALLVAAHELPVHEHDRPIHEAAVAELAARLKTTPGDLVAKGKADLALDDLLNLARELATTPGPAPGGSPAGLTPREMEVLRLVAEGASNRGIAERLSLSERTVENHVLHILTKLGLESRTAAATWAVRHGIA